MLHFLFGKTIMGMKRGFPKTVLGTGSRQFVGVMTVSFLFVMGLFSSVVLAQEKHQQVVSSLHKKKEKRKAVGRHVRHKKRVQEKKAVSQDSATHQPDSVEKPLAAGAVTAGGTAAAAMPVSEPEKGTVTGLPLPHFLALRADDVNMRAGPGTRYPIIWIYHRRFMPVKVLREFDVWRLVEDVDGQKGWVQQAILSRERAFIITGAALTVIEDNQSTGKDAKDKSEIRHTDSVITSYVPNSQTLKLEGQEVILRSAPQDTASPVAVLKPGTVGHIKECAATVNWCKVKVISYTGWIPRDSFWGVLPQEIIQSP